jgi:hypothetical protein
VVRFCRGERAGEPGQLVPAVSDVAFPAMRREVLKSLAALSDPDYQQKVWVQREYPRLNYFDDLMQNVHVLYDGCQVLPEPHDRLWSVLLHGDEVARLRALDKALAPLVDELGDAPDVIYLADPRWDAVMSAAALALASIVLAGGYWDA